ncbi:MAG: trigger factor [Spirochaetota bacterium]|nr:trigger factor [Spirochaetota bacterium]
MNLVEKKLENATVELEITVPEDTIEIEYKSVFNKIRSSAKLNGFRKGKAPIDLIERKYHEYADKEVLENIAKSSYLDAIKEKELEPINIPEFDIDKNIVRGEPFKFKVKIELAPTVELGEYKGLSIEELPCKVVEEDINNEIDSLRKNNANYLKKDTDKPVTDGDYIKLKIKRIDNIEVNERDNVEFTEIPFTVGERTNEFSFDKHVLGMKENEEKEIEIKYPKDFQEQKIAGQNIKYLIKVSEINVIELPELDDEFAKDIGEFSSLEDLRENIQEDIQKFVDSKSKSRTQGELIKQIIEKSKFDIPPSMVKSEMQAIFDRIQQRVGLQGVDIEKYTSMMKIDKDEFDKKLNEEALSNIKTTLSLTEIAKKEELKFSEEKYNKTIEGIAQKSNKSIEEIEEYASQSGMRENIELELLLDKALNLVYDNATIKKLKPVLMNDFLKEN